MKYILMFILLFLPVTAFAAWSEGPMPSPNFNPSQGQFTQHEVHMNVTPPVRIEPQHRVYQPQPIKHKVPPVIDRPQPVHHEPPVDRNRDKGYHRNVDFPVVVDTTTVELPDGFDTIVVQGQTYYYSEGVFYQLVGDQLVNIPPVIGAIVDNIPDNYVVVMADGVNYLFTDGVYYERVFQGFEVVAGPGSDQE